MFFAPAVSPRARAYDRGVERFFQQAYGYGRRVDVDQDEQSWTLTLDVPGVAREELNIGIEGAVVRIETKAEAKRQFKAAYELPQEIDAAASTAKLENGVLTLVLRKLVPVSKATTLQVN